MNPPLLEGRMLEHAAEFATGGDLTLKSDTLVDANRSWLMSGEDLSDGGEDDRSILDECGEPPAAVAAAERRKSADLRRSWNKKELITPKAVEQDHGTITCLSSRSKYTGTYDIRVNEAPKEKT